MASQPSDYRKNSQKTKQPESDTRHRRQKITALNERACPEENYNDQTITTDTTRDTAPKNAWAGQPPPKKTTLP